MGTVPEAIAQLDRWLESMHGPQGYCGPVAHWWESCLLYTGPMVDWRYEGIILGYLQLYRNTGQGLWLEKAQRAGDEAVSAQLPSGNYRNSSFQAGALPGGTPHEAAVDVALLELAKELTTQGNASGQRYFVAAERNIRHHLLGQLWNGRGFQDQPWDPTLVPNKNATVLEALLLYEELAGCSMTEYLPPAGDVILRGQVQEGPRRGGIVHPGTGVHRLTIGIYTARCLCALLRLNGRYPNPRYLAAVEAGAAYLTGLVTERGSFFGSYPGGETVRCPRWISPSGELLRALLAAQEWVAIPQEAIADLRMVLLSNQYPSGGLPTAYGFAQRGSTREPMGLPDFRDVLPVVGWCDKAFRALAWDCPAVPSALPLRETRQACFWKGQQCWYHEDEGEIRLDVQASGHLLYRWEKGAPAPSHYAL